MRIKANLNLRSYFFLKETISNWQILGDVKLSNKKRYEVYLAPKEKKIVIQNVKAKKDQLYSGVPLTSEERCAIIELLLGIYGTDINSLFHLSMSYNIELYRLIDATTGKRDDVVDAMIFEYVKNVKFDEKELQYQTIFTTLKEIYTYLDKNKENIKPGIINAKLDKRISKGSLEKFALYILNYFGLEKEYVIIFNKKDCNLELKKR